jgi:hypothetical protein
MTFTGLAPRVAIPPVAGFVLLAAYVAAEALGFHAFARTEANTLAEATALGHAARAIRLIASGQAVNDRFEIRAGILDHEKLELTPLDAAILGRHAELVRLLKRSGANYANSARTACFARIRLPEVLSDLDAPSAESTEQSADVETTIKTCSPEGAPL